MPRLADNSSTMILFDDGTRRDGATIGTKDSFAQLVAALVQLDLGGAAAPEVERLLGLASVGEAALAPFVNFLPDRYTRNCVYRDERFEVLVLCWSPGSRSPIHDHGGSRCFVKVVRGSLSVDNYAIVAGGYGAGHAELAGTGTQIMNPGDVDIRTPAHDVHRVAAHQGAAISLHVYAKPLDQCLVFDITRQSCRTAVNRYDRPPAR